MRFSSSILATAGLAALVAAVPSSGPVKRGTKIKFFGVNESGPEFGTAIPGVKNTDYVWPDLTTLPVCPFSAPDGKCPNEKDNRASSMLE
jgi:hypothetical protein